MILKFSRTSLREAINKLVTEMEDGVMVSGDEVEGMEVVPGDQPTGLKSAAQQAAGSVQELIKQAQAHGADTSDYSDVVDQIHSDFALPGGTAEVQ